MIKVKHPLEYRNQEQETCFTKSAPEARRLHELMYSYSNAAARYDQEFGHIPPSEQDYEEWLQTLHPAIAKVMAAQGFAGCCLEHGFIRFMKKKREPVLEAYVRELMGEEEYQELKSLSGTA
ncbi:hypothetical protein [Pontibacter pamirensis]|uniref:hypothetical protein n=1 Tax=Pontibacter pamirensis TaxID=2562824 RepID=UPI00138A0921|nr:hypothetical protein [Pontibacter pamirensis]